MTYQGLPSGEVAEYNYSFDFRDWLGTYYTFLSFYYYMSLTEVLSGAATECKLHLFTELSLNVQSCSDNPNFYFRRPYAAIQPRC